MAYTNDQEGAERLIVELGWEKDLDWFERRIKGEPSSVLKSARAILEEKNDTAGDNPAASTPLLEAICRAGAACIEHELGLRGEQEWSEI